MSQERVAVYMRERGLKPRFVTFSDTHSSHLAAEAVGCELGQIAKTICFVTSAGAVLVIAPGDRRVSTKKLRGLVGAKPKLAGPDEVLAITGYPPGAVAPVGLATEVPVYLDESLRRFDAYWCGGGATNAVVSITLADLGALTAGEWADLCE